MNVRIFGSALATALAFAGLAACGDRADTTAAEVRQDARNAAATVRREAADATATMGAAAGRAGEKMDDMQITTRVNAGLAADKDLSALRIDVDTKDGVVTLMGTAPTATAKARAAEVAREVKDVKSVNNQLTVAG